MRHVSPNELQNRTQNIINFLNNKGIKKIILLTTIPTKTFANRNIKIKTYNDWIKTLNGKNGITVVDAASNFYTNSNVNTNYYIDDLHPNELGKKAMSEALDLYIAKLLVYEGPIDEPFNASDEPFTLFLMAGTKTINSFLSTYLLSVDEVINLKNTIDVNELYLNHKYLSKLDKRTSYGFVVLHDGGDIPICKDNKDQENCVIKNIILGQWKNSGLSSHYYIGCDGKIFKLISENYIAMHAGCNKDYCVKGMNNVSIGVDLRNCSRYTENKSSYTNAQHNSLNLLLKDMYSRGIIKEIVDETVIAHFEINKNKGDPEAGFNWLIIDGLLEDHRLLRENNKDTPFQKALKKVITDTTYA